MGYIPAVQGTWVHLDIYLVAKSKSDVNYVPDLFSSATTTCIGDGPGSLLPRLEFRLRLNVDQDREDVSIYHGLDLLPVTSGDVGDGPARLISCVKPF